MAESLFFICTLDDQTRTEVQWSARKQRLHAQFGNDQRLLLPTLKPLITIVLLAIVNCL